MTSNAIAGNLIGTDVTGENALANTDDGILLSHAGNTIGGPTAASRNVIAADGLRGIELDNANSNLVEDNLSAPTPWAAWRWGRSQWDL